MLETNQHIDAILHGVLAQCSIPHEVRVLGKHAISIHLSFDANEEHRGIARNIVISRENDVGKFKVAFTEISKEPHFFIQQEETILDTDDHDIDRAQRLVYAHIHGPIKPFLIPSQEHVDRWQDINERWLINSEFHLELYSPNKRRYDEWRMRIKHVTGVVVCDHLSADTTTGHTCVLITGAVQDAFKRGVIEGETRAAERLAVNIFKIAIPRDPGALYQYPKEVLDLRLQEGIRSKLKTI